MADPLGGGCGSPSSTEVATRRGAREFRLAPTKLISHEILMISQDLTSDVFFLGGNPCISTHYPSPFFWNLSTPSHLWEVETHQVGMLCWYHADTFCKFLLDGWFVRFAAHFCCFVGATFLLRQDIAQEADLQWFPLRLSTASSIDQQRTTGENTAVPRSTSVRELMTRRCRGLFCWFFDVSRSEAQFIDFPNNSF